MSEHEPIIFTSKFETRTIERVAGNQANMNVNIVSSRFIISPRWHGPPARLPEACSIVLQAYWVLKAWRSVCCLFAFVQLGGSFLLYIMDTYLVNVDKILLIALNSQIAFCIPFLLFITFVETKYLTAITKFITNSFGNDRMHLYDGNK